MANRNKGEIFMACLDIKKAYDAVSIEAIELSMRRIKIPEMFIQIIRNLHSEHQLRVITRSGLTESFHPELGIPQGETLGPIYFMTR